LALIILVGVVLMLIPGKKEENAIVPEVSVSQPTVSIREELEKILSNIQGTGRVQVMLTEKGGEQVVYQTDTPGQNREDTVIITGQDRDQAGLVQQILAPTFRGAIILCQGADSPAVCLAVKEAVSKVTGLDTSEISVLKMK
jgi:stage III sporulation protein AG